VVLLGKEVTFFVELLGESVVTGRDEKEDYEWQCELWKELGLVAVF